MNTSRCKISKPNGIDRDTICDREPRWAFNRSFRSVMLPSFEWGQEIKNHYYKVVNEYNNS